MHGFVLRLIPPRPDFAATMSEEEREVMGAHVTYWGELLSSGRVVAFGPVADPDGPYGIGIVLAPDTAAAELLRDGDPVMRARLGFRTEIAPMPHLLTATGAYSAESQGGETA